MENITLPGETGISFKKIEKRKKREEREGESKRTLYYSKKP